MSEKGYHLFYKDTGCKRAKKEGYSGGCLDCPFVQCFEEPEPKQEFHLPDHQVDEIRELRNNGKPIDTLIKIYHTDFYNIKRICGEL